MKPTFSGDMIRSNGSRRLALGDGGVPPRAQQPKTIQSEMLKSSTVTETILDCLESIELLDSRVTDSMRAAYCAVARVRALEQRPSCGLVSPALKMRGAELEAGVTDIQVSKRFSTLDSGNDALRYGAGQWNRDVFGYITQVDLKD